MKFTLQVFKNLAECIQNDTKKKSVIDKNEIETTRMNFITITAVPQFGL